MKPSPWRIVFFGTPSFALPALGNLIQGPDEIAALVTQPDREKGRGRKVIPSPVKELGLKHHLKILQPEKVKEEIFQESLRTLRPDLFVVVAFGQILPGSLLKIPKYGAINVHASLLPKYRGAAPIAWAILNGDAVTGVTTMKMDEGMDTGDVLLQEAIPIESDETAESLHEKLAPLGARLLSETIGKLKEGTLFPVPQDQSRASYASMLKKEDGRIDWTKEAKEIDRRVRAFNPWPAAYTIWENHFIKIYKGEVREDKPGGKPGVVLWVGTDFIEVGTGKGVYLIREIQLEGKRRMCTREFLSGHPLSAGAVFR